MRNTDLLVHRSHLSFRGGNIRAPFEQRRGYADRDGRRRQFQYGPRNGERHGRLSNQDGDGVFELGARNSKVDQLRPCRMQLRFRLSHVPTGGDARLETVLGE